MSRASDRPRLAVTMGDAAGIGPEIIVRALADPVVATWCVPVVLGDARVLTRVRESMRVACPIRAVRSARDATGEPGVLECVDFADVDLEVLRPGTISASNGAAAVRYTREAARLALRGDVDGIVSAPLNKAAMHEAGYAYQGHTEILAEEAGAPDCTMVVLSGKMRIMLCTNHVSLREACDLMTAERILAKIELARQGLQAFSMARSPRLAVAGLNPHAGEDGLFGREEIDGISPAIEAARAKGIDVVGPLPADTLFVKARQGVFDMVLALYHDQGLMPAKLVGFGSVVTLLFGLPFVRTSVGHGTAYDIAGSGRADHGNMLEAIRVASKTAGRRSS